MNGTPIVCEGIIRRFGRREVLSGVGLEVGKGRIVGLLGPNGAGKTTLIRIITGQITPSGGRVLIGGNPLRPRDRGLMRTLGLVPQEPALYRELTLRENLLLMASIYGLRKDEATSRCGELLDEMGLSGHADRRAEECSAGMRQALSVLMGMIHRPYALLLDEPTVGLDPKIRSLVLCWD